MGEDSLRIGYANNYVHIQNYFLSEGSTYRIDRIEFADGTVWTYSDIKNRLLQSTEEADELTGFADNNVIDGQGGNDSINGKAGDDILNGNVGNDDLQGGIGNDTLEGGEGKRPLTGLWHLA